MTRKAQRVTFDARAWAMLVTLIAAAVTCNAMPAFAFLSRPIIFPSLKTTTTAPRGWLQFCADNPGECKPPHEGPREVALTPDELQQLYAINAYANDRVRWTPDIELYGKTENWAYPLNRGDCEDIVLLKRRLLADAGWPISSLLITTVEDKINRGHHAVLTVHTDRGELILDNQTPEILLWYETNYRFLSRQSTTDPNVWVAFSIDQPRPGGVQAH